MGTISNRVAPKKAPLPKAFTNIHVSSASQMKCKQCARVCPMQLTPYDSRGEEIGYLHPDCLKCGKCTLACPTKIMTLKLPAVYGAKKKILAFPSLDSCANL